MTLDELRNLPDTTITPAVAATVIGCDPQYIRIAAKKHPEYLGFPIIIIGKRVHIPRLALINFLEGKPVEQ